MYIDSLLVIFLFYMKSTSIFLTIFIINFALLVVLYMEFYYLLPNSYKHNS
jgi:hypothetical protein